MTCCAPSSASARAIGPSLTNWGRAPTTLRTFTADQPTEPLAAVGEAVICHLVRWSALRTPSAEALHVRIAVVALGKIGLPLAVQFATKGHQVVGADISAATVE